MDREKRWITIPLLAEICYNNQMDKKIPSNLNIRNSSGRWYVSLRGARLSIVKGFVGSREALDALLRDRAEEIEEAIRQHDRRFTDSQRSRRMDGAVTVIASASKRAKARGLEFRLTMDWLLARLETSGDRCEISGAAFDYSPEKTMWHKRPDCPSLDRIDRTLGYVDGNVRVVCTAVNIAINEWGEERFYKMCADVLRTRKNGVQKRPVSVVFGRAKRHQPHNVKGKKTNEINKITGSRKGF